MQIKPYNGTIYPKTSFKSNEEVIYKKDKILIPKDYYESSERTINWLIVGTTLLLAFEFLPTLKKLFMGEAKKI